jgi:hypothetical protein
VTVESHEIERLSPPLAQILYPADQQKPPVPLLFAQQLARAMAATLLNHA